MISVLLPSRGRPAMLRESVESLIGLHVDYAECAFEILVIGDHDDPDTRMMALDLIKDHYVEEYFEVNRYGYGELYRYYNDLAEMASGDWLMLWNDDAVMLTAGWNDRIWHMPDEALVADLQSQLSPQFVAFPAMRRSMYEVLGHFSAATPHVDSYIQDIARTLGRVRPVDVHVDHRRPDLTGEQPDATYLEGRAGLAHQHYFSPEFQAVIGEAIEKVREAGI